MVEKNRCCIFFFLILQIDLKDKNMIEGLFIYTFYFSLSFIAIGLLSLVNENIKDNLLRIVFFVVFVYFLFICFYFYNSIKDKAVDYELTILSLQNTSENNEEYEQNQEKLTNQCNQYQEELTYSLNGKVMIYLGFPKINIEKYCKPLVKKETKTYQY